MEGDAALEVAWQMEQDCKVDWSESHCKSIAQTEDGKGVDIGIDNMGHMIVGDAEPGKTSEDTRNYSCRLFL